VRAPGRLLCAALTLAGSFGALISSAGADPRPTPPDAIVNRGTLVTDGTMDVGQTETLRVTGLVGKVKLKLQIAPPLTGSCSSIDLSGVCVSAPIPPAPGTPPFRTDRKGRATLTFVMPDHYDLENFRTQARTPVLFTNGQQVIVTASGLHAVRHNGRKGLMITVGAARAPVATPPPPAPTA
jgi:hypothetical protein